MRTPPPACAGAGCANKVEAVTGTQTTKYLVDGNRALALVVAEYNTAGTITASYVYADDIISMTKNSQTYYYHFDGLGSTRLLTDSTGTVTDTYDYDAFGNLINRTGTTENTFLFTGQQYDANIGFYYLRARLYQPTTGRFTSYDPIEGDIYTPSSLHKYLYTANDPVNKIDPSGKQSSTLVEEAYAMEISSDLFNIGVLSMANMLVLLEPPLVLYRYTSARKIREAITTDLVIGDYGVTWWTPDFFATPEEARQFLSLEYMPEGWLRLRLYLKKDFLIGPTFVSPKPKWQTTGGGQEYWTLKAIPYSTRSGISGYWVINLP